jgi:hypothetical protein
VYFVCIFVNIHKHTFSLTTHKQTCSLQYLVLILVCIGLPLGVIFFIFIILHVRDPPNEREEKEEAVSDAETYLLPSSSLNEVPIPRSSGPVYGEFCVCFVCVLCVFCVCFVFVFCILCL